MSEARGQRENADAVQTQLALVAEIFEELFTLLEQYAPVWYLEEHHNRAESALRALNDLRQKARGKATRSHKAGSG